MDKRKFLGAMGAAAAATLGRAHAQPTGKVFRIGILSSAPTRTDAQFAAWNWVKALRDLGWIEGRNAVFVRRNSDGKSAPLPGLARELVAEKVDLIATFSSRDAMAAKQASSTIPIVMVFSGFDPVADGLIASFARPGGNVTGVSRMLTETFAKRLELIREILPSATRIAALAPRDDDSGAKERLEQAKHAAGRNLRVELESLTYDTIDDVYAAFPAMAGRRVQAFLLEPHFFTFTNRGRIAELALTHRLPGVFTLKEYAVAGGLLSYGPDYPSLERQHARFVDRILRGANPADLPIEQPTKFDLVVNRRTAKALGLAVPQSLLLRADEVIET